MMTPKTLYFFTLIFITSFLISCYNKDDDNENNTCVEFDIAYVTSVSAPNTANVDDTINIEVSFRVFNGCGQFERFIETETDNARAIEVEAKYEGCICTQDAPILTANYEFTPSEANDYELNFKSSPTEFISITLSVD